MYTLFHSGIPVLAESSPHEEALDNQVGKMAFDVSPLRPWPPPADQWVWEELWGQRWALCIQVAATEYPDQTQTKSRPWFGSILPGDHFATWQETDNIERSHLRKMNDLF